MLDAVAAADAHGAHVVLATGRPFLSAQRYAEAFDLRTPLICFQGALVKELAGDHARSTRSICRRAAR